jgi:hypothetical protein
MLRGTSFRFAVLCAAALCASGLSSDLSHAAGVATVPCQGDDGVASVTDVTDHEAEGEAASPVDPVPGGSREATILWHRHFEDPIYTSVGISGDAGLSFAGTFLNAPKHVEAVPLVGDGTPDWTAGGNEFYVDASRGGEVLAAIDYNGADSTAVISEWAPGSYAPLWSYEVHPCRSLVYGGWASRKPIRVSDDGSTIAVGVTMRTPGGDMGRLYVFDAGDPTPVVKYDLPSGSITAIEITGHGEYVALASWPTVYVYDRYGLALRWSGPIGAGNDALAISADGRYLAWGWSTLYLREWTGSTYSHLWSTNQGSGYYLGQCGFSPDGSSFAVTWDNGNSYPNNVWVELYDLPSLDFVWEYDYANSVRLGSPATGPRRVPRERQHVDIPTRLTFAPDSERFAISSWGGEFPEIHVFDRSDSRPLFTLETPGSMYDVGIFTTPAGDSHVVACGKGVHAGTGGRGGDHYSILIPGDPSGVEHPDDVQATFPVVRSYPNPFRDETAISYSLARSGRVRLTVHDVNGRVVATLVDGTASAGEHTVEWNGRDGSGMRAASGVYFARLEAGGRTGSERIVLIR